MYPALTIRLVCQLYSSSSSTEAGAVPHPGCVALEHGYIISACVIALVSVLADFTEPKPVPALNK